MELNIRIAGAAGQGMQTIGYILSKVFSRGGHEVFSVMDYQSRVRGGHNYYQIRVSDRVITAKNDELDMLVALNKESIELEKSDIKDGGIIIYDGGANGEISYEKCQMCVSVPFAKIAVEAAGDKIYSNTAAVGAVLGFIGYDLEILYDVINKFFYHKKGAGVAKSNIDTARAGAKFAKKSDRKPAIEEMKCTRSEKMLINGNEAIALGALAAGCKFFCSYPMTPSTSIFVNAAKYSHEFNAVVEQAEDEMAAINMIIGASYAGVRSMTTTSGGGYCLMVEGIGFAAIAELPVVIVNSQRSGPSTGLPTRTEQGDLLFTINASHGDFLRVVLAPSSPRDAFYLTIKAFELADKYQLPVTILDDQYLADTYVTIDEFDLSGVSIDRHLMSDDELSGLDEYHRYAVTDSGISPRALPSQSRHVVVSDSDEHTSDGHLTEDIDAAMQMKHKRASKLKRLDEDMKPPDIFGDAAAKNVLLTWGSTFGVAHELLEQKKKDSISLVNIQEIWPLSGEFFEDFLKDKRCIAVEGNQSGQLAKLIRQISGIKVDTILKYDGRPFTLNYLEEKLKEKGVL